MKETRNDLAKHLEKIEYLEKEKKGEVLNFNTKFATNAELITDFITEIGKNKETTNSLKSGDILPTGNWIRQFKSFKDIIESLRPFILIEDLNVKFHKELLKDELLKHSLSLHGKFKENPQDISLEFDKVCEAIPAPKTIYDDVLISKDVWEDFIIVFYLTSLMPINIDSNIIYKTLTNDVFYEYDSSTNKLVKQPIYEDLIQLKSRLVSCNNMKERSKDFHTQLTEIMNRNSKQSSVAVNPVHLLEILVYFSNIMGVSQTLCNCL